MSAALHAQFVSLLTQLDDAPGVQLSMRVGAGIFVFDNQTLPQAITTIPFTVDGKHRIAVAWSIFELLQRPPAPLAARPTSVLWPGPSAAWSDAAVAVCSPIDSSIAAHV